MHNDIQAVLSSMLAEWHHYCRHTAEKHGFAGKAAVFGQSRSNSQFDWENGIESDRVDRLIMQGFDSAINRIKQPYLTALQFEARNLVARHQVWTSPRLPVNKQEREVLILEARVLLLKELASDGVLC